MNIVFHPGLIFGSAFLNRFHPFEFDRAVRALELLRDSTGGGIDDLLRAPEAPVTLSELESIHSPAYLDSLKLGATIAQVIEVPFLAWMPRRWLSQWFLEPARWSLAASLLAGRLALDKGLCVSLGGGFHHAKRQGGEGFCLLNDIAYLVETLRSEKRLSSEGRVLYVDLDVHQGNGVSHYYAEDPRVRILDIFNRDIYPVCGADVSGEVEVARPLPTGCTDEQYLSTLENALPELFEAWESSELLIYNAGTDVFHEDRLGGFRLTRDGVKERDRLLLAKAKALGIPTVVLASGGYSKSSAILLADLILSAREIYDKAIGSES